MNKVLEEIGKTGIVPVVVLEEAEAAVPLAEALCKGGPCLCRGNLSDEGGEGSH